MIRVLLFAKLRELFNAPEYQLALPQGDNTVLTVIHALSDLLAQQYSAALAAQCLLQLQSENTLYAVNHELATIDAKIFDNDEVAFYPPVTGG